jgi:hypothetical protein
MNCLPMYRFPRQGDSELAVPSWMLHRRRRLVHRVGRTHTFTGCHSRRPRLSPSSPDRKVCSPGQFVTVTLLPWPHVTAKWLSRTGLRMFGGDTRELRRTPVVMKGYSVHLLGILQMGTGRRPHPARSRRGRKRDGTCAEMPCGEGVVLPTVGTDGDRDARPCCAHASANS